MDVAEPGQIYLPSPSQSSNVSLEEAIARRRSIRNSRPEAISELELSQLLWAAQGILDSTYRRAAPSAGATYPLEIFIACGQNGITNIDEGIYHYRPHSHSLTRHYKGDVRAELEMAALGQEFIYQAPVNIIICAIYERTLRRYGGRGERYVHMEVGHAGQNIYLQASALGLGTVAIGAFDDEEVREVLRLDKQYKPLYIMPVGKPS